jgi:L-amino acid N-acyltransferase YncA
MDHHSIERFIMNDQLWVNVLGWRNDPLVYKWSRTNRPITLTEHVEWFKNRKHRLELEPVYAYFYRKSFVGMARLDLLSDEAYEVSLIVNPLYRGQGYGKLVLKDICELFSQSMLFRYKLFAVVHDDNKASQHLFNSFGFQPIAKQGNLLTYIFRKT